MKHRRLILVVVVLLVVWTAGVEALRAYRAKRVISEWEGQVESALSATATPEDAKDQLESLGFELMHWNRQASRGWLGSSYATSSGETVQTLIVTGFKKTDIFWPPRPDPWIQVVVHFDLQETYKGPEVGLSPITMVWNQKTP